jgi:hypothetical protein
MSRSFGSNLESFSAIRGLFICHISCQLVSAIKPYEGFGDVDHTIKEIMSL